MITPRARPARLHRRSPSTPTAVRLRRAARPGDTTVPAAAVVARRTGSDLAVTGSFLRIGTRFRVTVHLQDLRDGWRIVSQELDAKDESGIVSLVDTLTRRLRSDPGLAATADLDRELAAVTTSSPEAFHDYSEAHLLHYQDRLGEAAPLLQRAVSLDPGFALALSKLSVLRARMGEAAEARELSERAMARRERLPPRERFYVEGNRYSWREVTFARVIDAYRRATELYPDHWAAGHNLATVYLELELFDEASRQLERVARGVPERITVHSLLAVAQLSRGDPAAACTALSRVPAEDPWGALEVAELEAEAAEAALERVRRLDPEAEPSEELEWQLHLLREDWPWLEAWSRRVEEVEPARDRAPQVVWRGRGAGPAAPGALRPGARRRRDLPGGGRARYAEGLCRRVVEQTVERFVWPLEYVRSLHRLAQIARHDGAQEEAHHFLRYWEQGTLDRASVREARRDPTGAVWEPQQGGPRMTVRSRGWPRALRAPPCPVRPPEQRQPIANREEREISNGHDDFELRVTFNSDPDEYLDDLDTLANQTNEILDKRLPGTPSSASATAVSPPPARGASPWPARLSRRRSRPAPRAGEHAVRECHRWWRHGPSPPPGPPPGGPHRPLVRPVTRRRPGSPPREIVESEQCDGSSLLPLPARGPDPR
jgi:Flp pilus assembly protein TadD